MFYCYIMFVQNSTNDLTNKLGNILLLSFFFSYLFCLMICILSHDLTIRLMSILENYSKLINSFSFVDFNLTTFQISNIILPSLSLTNNACNASLASSSLNFFHTLIFNSLDMSIISLKSFLVPPVDPINFTCLEYND